MFRNHFTTMSRDPQCFITVPIFLGFLAPVFGLGLLVEEPLLIAVL